MTQARQPARKGSMKVLPIPGDLTAAVAWGTYSGVLLLAQVSEQPIIDLTVGHAILAGCMAGGTIGALVWREPGDHRPKPAELALRWFACFSAGGACAPAAIWLITKYTAIPLRPEIALVLAWLSSLSGWWLVQYLRAQGPGGLLKIVRNVCDALRGKSP